MQATRSCEQCGKEIPSDAPEGLCSACLVTFAVDGFRDGPIPPPFEGSPAFSPREKKLWHFGDYELLEEIARGGMGVVYRARQISLDRIVAVKMIRAGQLASEAEVRRFRLEAEAAARLQHPNIVAIHEVGEIDGQHFFSMDYIGGKSLAEIVRERPLSAQLAARYVQTIARAIHYAHQHGIVHRDLKPSNVMIDSAGEPRITDFGLAKVLRSGSDATITTTVMGSPSYMPPEQTAGGQAGLSFRSDIYSLGAILYELVTGRPPFHAESAIETMRQVVESEPVPPRLLNPAVPRDLETICLKCLEKSPAKRYPDAQELAEELERFLRDEPIRARPISRAEKLWRLCRRNPALAGLSSATLLLLIAVAIGSTVAVFRISRESLRATQAHADANDKLWASYLAQARAERLSGRVGRRTASLAAIAAAAKMKPSLELRNEAIASLALTDLGERLFWRDVPAEFKPMVTRFDSDLRRYAVGHNQGQVTIYRAKDHEVLAELSGPPLKVVSMVFSPDGNYLGANFLGGDVWVWRLDRPALPASTNYPKVRDLPDLMDFSPDSSQLAIAANDGQIHLFNLSSDDELASWPVSPSIYLLDFAPLGRTLSVTIGGEVQIWDVAEARRIKSLKHNVAVSSLDWHPDARHLAAGYANGELWLWDAETGEKLLLPGATDYISSLAFNHQGDLLVSHGWDAVSRFWDATTGRPLFATDQILARQFSRDGQRLFCSQVGPDFGVVNLIRSGSFRTFRSPRLANLARLNVALTANGAWLSGGGNRGWHLWEVTSGKEIAFQPWPQRTWSLLDPTGNSLFAVTADTVMRYRLERQTNSLEVQIDSGQLIVSAKGSDFQRACLAANGEVLAVAGSNHSLLIDLKDPIHQIPFAQDERVGYVALSPDKRWIVAAANYGSGVSVWDSQSGAYVRHLITNDNAQVAFSPDGGTLVSRSFKEYCFWDTGSWRVRRRVPLALAGATGGPVVFSQDGKSLALRATYHSIKLLDPQTGDELATLTAPDAQPIESLDFSSDGSVLAAATSDRIVQLWDLHKLRGELAAMNLDWR